MAVKEYKPSSDKKIHKTSIDFVLRNCPREVHIVQYDKTQPIVEVELFNNGKKYSLPENAIMNLRFSKPDRTFVYKAVLGCNKDRNTVYFDIDEQMSFLYGKVNPILELVLDDMIAGSSPIPIEIDRNPIQNGDLESSSEYPAIVEAANKALEAASKAEKAATEAGESIETLQPLLDLYNTDDIATKTWTATQLANYVTNEYFENALEGYLTIFDADNTYATKDYVTTEFGKYLPLTGGIVTGPTTFNDTVNINGKVYFDKNYIFAYEPIYNTSDILSTYGTIGLAPTSNRGFMDKGRDVSLTEFIGNSTNNVRNANKNPSLETIGYNSNFHGNRFFGLGKMHAIVEYSNDAGTTWHDYGATDVQIRNLLSGVQCSSFRLGGASASCSCSNMLRISITCSDFNVPDEISETDRIKYWTTDNRTDSSRYMTINSLYIWQTEVYNTHQLTIEIGTIGATTGTEPTWNTIGTLNKNYGWSGSTSFSFEQLVMGGGNSSADKVIRLTFRTQANDGSFDDSKLENVSQSSQNIHYIKAFGVNTYKVDKKYPNMLDDNIVRFADGNGIYTRVATSCASISPASVSDSKLLTLGTASLPWANTYTRCLNVLSTSPYVELNNSADTAVFSLSGINVSGTMYYYPKYKNGDNTLATLGDIAEVSGKYLPLTGGSLTGELTTNSSIKFGNGSLYENGKKITVYGYNHGDVDAINEETLFVSTKKPSGQGNRFFGLTENQMIVEYSTDGGKTWSAYSDASDKTRVMFVSLETGGGLWIGHSTQRSSCNNMLRITLTGSNFNVPEGTSETDRIKYWNKTRLVSTSRYCRINSILTRQVSLDNLIQCRMYIADIKSTDEAPTFNLFRTWEGLAGNNELSSLCFPELFWGYVGVIRLEFRTQANDHSFDDSKLVEASKGGQQIQSIQCYGDEVYISDKRFPQMEYGHNGLFSYSNGWQVAARYTNIHCTIVPYENGIQGFGQSELHFRHLYLNNEWLYGELKLFKDSSTQTDDKALRLSGNGIDKIFSLNLPNNEGILFSIQKGNDKGLKALLSDTFHFVMTANDENDSSVFSIINTNSTSGLILSAEQGYTHLKNVNGQADITLSDDSAVYINDGLWVDSNGYVHLENTPQSNTDATPKQYVDQCDQAYAGGWHHRAKIAEKPITANAIAVKSGSGVPASAHMDGMVSINTFERSLGGKVEYKTVVDVTYRCDPFALKPVGITAALITYGTMWYFPYVNVNRDFVNEPAYTTMLSKLMEQKARVGVSMDETVVFRDMTTNLGALNGNGTFVGNASYNSSDISLFGILAELDTDHKNDSMMVSGAHFKLTFYHPEPIN